MNVSRLRIPWILAAFLAAAAACGSGGGDTADAVTSDTSDNPDTATGPAVTSLLVQVFTSSKTALSGATVTLGTQVATTNEAGQVHFDGLQPGRAVAKVQAAGYAPATAVGQVYQDVATSVTVRLMPLAWRYTFDVADGALLINQGVRVAIPPSAVVGAAGKAVTGEVQATIAPLDPSTQDVWAAPGPFQGQPAAGGDPVILESGFMADVTLWSGDQKLQLAPGMTATLTFALPDAIQNRTQPGDTIPLWTYDLDAGLWKEEGPGTVAAIAAVHNK